MDKEFTISILDKRFWDLTKENDNFGFGVFAKVKYDCLLVRDSCLRMREENKDDKEGITFWMKKLIWVSVEIKSTEKYSEIGKIVLKLRRGSSLLL